MLVRKTLKENQNSEIRKKRETTALVRDNDHDNYRNVKIGDKEGGNDRLEVGCLSSYDCAAKITFVYLKRWRSRAW